MELLLCASSFLIIVKASFCLARVCVYMCESVFVCVCVFFSHVFLWLMFEYEELNLVEVNTPK